MEWETASNNYQLILYINVPVSPEKSSGGKKYGKLFSESSDSSKPVESSVFSVCIFLCWVCVHESLWKSDFLTIVVELQHKYSNICNNPNGWSFQNQYKKKPQE